MGQRTGNGGATYSPDELRELLRASDPSAREAAWQAFLDRFNGLLMSTVREYADGYDQVMDRYSFVLEQLRRDDFHRLRRYENDGRATFQTWLVVVAGRLCLDFRRRQYGRRPRDGSNGGVRLRSTIRRRLADFVAEELEPGLMADASVESPEMAVRRRELFGALDEAVDALDAPDRLLLRLRFLEGLTAREVARAMQLPSQFHVYRRGRRLLERLRENLNGRGFAEPRP